MKLPNLTHLQMLVLGAIAGETSISGKAIRNVLKEYGCNKSAPAFYQLMSRLEEAHLVKGRYISVDFGDSVVRERCYEITGEGRRALTHSVEFTMRIEAIAVGGIQGA